jgi:stress-induced-phosphoprotein 1
MTRKGNALMKMGKLEEAISTYNRSLTEHRNADTLKRLNEAEKALKDKTESEYINMDLCGEEKDKGNAAFKEQKYPEAVKYYTEAIKRGPPSVNPEAHKLFSNRAACYTKLGAWNEGLKDAEECIKLAPEFAKGYSRKGHLQYFMKEYSKAMSTYEEGLKHDPENAELKDGLSRCVQAINRVRRSVVFLRDWVVTCQGNLSLLYLLQMNRGEMSEEELKQRQERGMADPEIQGILSDPIMRQVLREMEENPASAQKHLAHPDIAKKFEKLVAAGIVQVR